MLKTRFLIHKVKTIQELQRNFSLETDKSKGKLLFADGIYDFETKTFINEFNPEIVFNGRIPRNFPKYLLDENDENNPQYIEFKKTCEKVNKILFIDPYTSEQIEHKINEFYKQGLARCIAGEYEAKRCYFGVGDANSGRGLLSTSFMKAFGGEEGYCSSFNMNNLLLKPGNTDDEAKKNAWLIPIANKRLCFANEVNIAGAIDGGAFKSAVSGGDQIKARLLNKNEQMIIIKSGLVFLTNDIPKIVPCDKGITNRACVIEFKKAFVETKKKDDDILQDISLVSYMKTDKACDALVAIIIKAYNTFVENGRPNEKPDLVRLAASEWLETNSSVESILKSVYEITNNPIDKISFKEIYNTMINLKLRDSSTKIGRELSKLGLEKKYIKTGGSVCVYYIGIKKIIQMDES